jgi:hypothetical protein
VALLPPLPMRPADVLRLYYQHTNTPAKRKRPQHQRHPKRPVVQLEFKAFRGRWPWRSQTFPMRPLTRKEKPFLTRKEARALNPKERKARRNLRVWMREGDKLRPLTREDCVSGPRPCAFISCQHHLYTDTMRSGSLKMNFPPSPPKSDFVALPMPRIEAHQALRLMKDTCALDVADRGGVTLEEIGVLLNVSMERARQILDTAIDKMRLEVDDDYSLKDSEKRQRAIREMIAARLARSNDVAEDDDEEG